MVSSFRSVGGWWPLVLLCLLVAGCSAPPEQTGGKLPLPDEALDLSVSRDGHRLVVKGAREAGLSPGQWLAVRRAGEPWDGLDGCVRRCGPMLAWLHLAAGAWELEADVIGNEDALLGGALEFHLVSGAEEVAASRHPGLVTVEEGLTESPLLGVGAVGLVTPGRLYGQWGESGVEAIYEVVTALDETSVAERRWGRRLPAAGDILFSLGMGQDRMEVLLWDAGADAAGLEMVQKTLEETPGVRMTVTIEKDVVKGECFTGAAVGEGGQARLLQVRVTDSSVAFSLPGARPEHPGVEDAWGCVELSSGSLSEAIQFAAWTAAGQWEQVRFRARRTLRRHDSRVAQLALANEALQAGDLEWMEMLLGQTTAPGENFWLAGVEMDQGRADEAIQRLERLEISDFGGRVGLQRYVLTSNDDRDLLAPALQSESPRVLVAASAWDSFSPETDELPDAEPGSRAEMLLLQASVPGSNPVGLAERAATSLLDGGAALDAAALLLSLVEQAPRDDAEWSIQAGLALMRGGLYQTAGDTFLAASWRLWEGGLDNEEAVKRLTGLMTSARRAYSAAGDDGGVGRAWYLAAQVLSRQLEDPLAGVDGFAAASFYGLRGGEVVLVAQAELELATLVIAVLNAGASLEDLPRGARQVDERLARVGELLADSPLEGRKAELEERLEGALRSWRDATAPGSR